MKKPELLSPAGNMECLKAAILGGCDAAYLGGYKFGARTFAGNFTNEEILRRRAISVAELTKKFPETISRARPPNNFKYSIRVVRF